MAATPEPLNPVIQGVINEVADKNRMARGIRACETRRSDFASEQEMLLTGVAMSTEARQLMNDRFSDYWGSFAGRSFRSDIDCTKREIVIGGGFAAAVYCASRVAKGFPKPFVLEQGSAEQVGGAFAMSLREVFRLNSRQRPGSVGTPDQDKALNYLPGGLLQPSMMSSEEYIDNALMAWLIRLTLMQNAVVYPGVTVTGLSSGTNRMMNLATSAGDITAGRVLDARGNGTDRDASLADNERVFTFSQFMVKMGGTFPLRGMQQVAVIGGGNSGLCAAESALGIAPGNTSVIGLDYVSQVDLYATTIDGRTCSAFRSAQRGRYIRLAQFLDGNVSNPSTRLRVMGQLGYASALPDGVLVNDRTYDMAVLCTGYKRPRLPGDDLSYFSVTSSSSGNGGVLAKAATPFESYRIGVAADIAFSGAEFDSGIASIPANRVSMFRNGPRTAALAAMLPAVGEKR